MTNEPNDFPPEFLAAYVDGELGPRDRARVERWLADHPERRALLEAQESFAADSDDLWLAVTPPQPSSRCWGECRQSIAHALRLPVFRRRWASRFGKVLLLATAAAVFLLIFNEDRSTRIEPQPTVREFAAVEPPFPMAADNEVRIVSLPEAAANLLVVGEHPLGDANFVLARADEVEFFGVGSDLAGRFPERPADPATEEIPNLWAPREP
ncbi:MAG TPA: hypothetical protein VHR66_28350 [Gemmataceae bacterium]|jgi:anti-sigma factor RsiW|nr:hypothetical protein [Gemmataceae bacterium]